jgi:hypothetical protein
MGLARASRRAAGGEAEVRRTVKDMKTFVLAKHHSLPPGTTFVCGSDPRLATLDADRECAARFDSPEAARAFRGRLGHQLGDPSAYHVHELHPDGRLIDLEP